MNRLPFTIEIHPRAWYALANLPKEAYERIKRGLAGVAENAAFAKDLEEAAATGGFLSLDGFLARYEVQPERRCVVVLDIERTAAGRASLAGPARPAGDNVLHGSTGGVEGASPGSASPGSAGPGSASPGSADAPRNVLLGTVPTALSEVPSPAAAAPSHATTEPSER